MPVNFAERVVPPRLKACQHAVKPFERIEFAQECLRRHFVNRHSGLGEYRFDLRPCALVPGNPAVAKRVPFAIGMANASQDQPHAVARGRPYDPGFDAPKTQDLPSQIDDITN
jgi:hypothetical protein